MTWDQVHRRHQLVEAVLTGIGEAGKPVIPAGLRPQVDAEFGGFEEFLCEVQLRWYRAFDAHLDAILEDGPDDMRAALVRLWQDLAVSRPAARLLLDAHAEHPALAGLHDQHRRRLYATTGIDLDPVRTAGHPVHRPSPRTRARSGTAFAGVIAYVRPAPTTRHGCLLARFL